ncbi:unnamed protein product [Bursaphelenchus xylophilus]|uniref:(pine wood nematode) hypothetical protein n=1 Tax=Bursaphelenchus xylophilus TaxID=6326 RepID=A0A1I7RHR1_BURXY|nr:unnamed protein product [Bursaphelenchus xylophilus]CAG9115476.1 unnamed protein product [Bursaphelenchus xylophilus]
MAKSTVSTKFRDLFSSRKVVFTPYRESGLLVLDCKSLVFLSVDPPSDVHDVPSYTKVSTIKIIRNIPGLSEICEIIPSENGKYVVLCGIRFIFIVEMPKDFWSCQSITSSRTFSHFRPTYNADFFMINPNLVLADNGTPIRKCEWLTSASLRIPFSMLGVLYEDNSLRVYKVSDSKSQPVVGVNFETVIRVGEEVSHTRGLGNAPKMVSFVFGPQVEDANDDQDWVSVLAVDSEGEIYYTEFHFNFDTDAQPIGPINLVGINPSEAHLYRQTEDLVYIKHSERCKLPTFAFCSDSGQLFHAVLNRKSSDDVELIVVDSLEIEDWDPKNLVVVLRRDPIELGQYLITTDKQVLSVDLNPTIESIASNRGANVEPSTIRALFKCISAEEVHLTSIGLVLLAKENDFVTLLAVMDSEDNYWANIIYRTVKGNNFKLESIRNVQPPPRKLKTILSEKMTGSIGIPQISIKAVSKEDRNKVINDAADRLLAQVTHQKEISETVLVFLAEVEKRAKALIDSKEEADRRLSIIFDNIQESKMKLACQRDEYKTLDDRFGRIIDAVEKKAYNLKDDRQARTSLDAIQKQCCDFSRELASANNNMLKVQAKLKAPVKPFQASVNAQKFMLSKNTVEIAELENLLRKLQRKLVRIETEY